MTSGEDDLLLHLLDTELEIAKDRARRSTATSVSMRPYLSRVVAVLSAIRSPDALVIARGMVDRFERETGAGAWLREHVGAATM